MTNKQINIAIAEACGWADIKHGRGLRPVAKEFNDESKSFIPDYCNDLNAMHEAEKLLNTNELWENYKACILNWMTEPVCATASQRAEAFLRTIEKWEGAK